MIVSVPFFVHLAYEMIALVPEASRRCVDITSNIPQLRRGNLTPSHIYIEDHFLLHHAFA
jgi:hypothetical protein